MNRLPITMEQDRKLGRIFLGACDVAGLVYIAGKAINNTTPDPNAVPLGNIVERDVNGDGKSDTDVQGRGSKAEIHYLMQYNDSGEPVLIPYAKEINIEMPYEEQRSF